MPKKMVVPKRGRIQNYPGRSEGNHADISQDDWWIRVQKDILLPRRQSKYKLQVLRNTSHTAFNFDASSFWRRGLQDVDLFQCWGHIKSEVEFAMQNENSLTHLQHLTCIPKAYVIHILSLTRSRIDPYFLLARKRTAIITTCVVCCSRMARYRTFMA
jgi:hypothetical protein